MVVVYLKNGEKAPMPDANEVKLEAGGPAQSLMLRCYFGSSEVGQFKWDEVAGYTVSVLTPDISSRTAYEAWGIQTSP
jgi:hypothetical protein